MMKKFDGLCEVLNKAHTVSTELILSTYSLFKKMFLTELYVSLL